jgi:hypothetical protein
VSTRRPALGLSRGPARALARTSPSPPADTAAPATALAALLVAAVLGCGAADVATVTLALSAPPDVDAADLTVTGPGMNPVLAAVTLPDATFSLDVPAGPARRFELHARVAGAPRWLGLATVDLAAGAASLTIPAVPAGAAHGRVTLAGAGVPDAALTFAAVAPPADFPASYTAVADAAGDYALWLPAGAYTVTAGVAVGLVPPDRASLNVATGVDALFDVALASPGAVAALALEVPAVLLGGLTPAATSFVVRALDAGGAPFAAYAGTVTFLGSDLGILGVPADYTFTAADAGAHTFDVTPLVPAGLGLLSVADVANPALAAAIVVVIDDPLLPKGPAVELVLMAAGLVGGLVPTPGTLTVAALDATGNLATGYLGTVTFADSDLLLLTVPGDYTFTAADGGSHVFPNALLPLIPVGSALVRAHDVVDPSIAGSLLVDILP